MKFSFGKKAALFLEFFGIGAFTVGGGYAMIPLIRRAVAEKRGWIDGSEMIDIVAVSESTPGPIAINAATFVGYRVAGFGGAFFATLGVVLPSFAVITIVARFYGRYKSSAVVEGCMSGVRPVVIGLIASALVTLASGVFFPQGIVAGAFGRELVSAALIFALTLYLAFRKVNPVWLILLSAVLGIAFGYAGDLI